MKFFLHSAIALLAVFSAVVNLRAQESELGILPPLPNLDLGDPDTKLTWNQNQLRKKIVAQERRMEEKEAKLREAEKPEGPSVAKRIASSLNQPQKAAISDKITVQNSLPSGEEGITASGSRLRAFGDENFWGAMPEPTPEESLADLPPLPDLRSSDQVTKTERLRDALVAKQELRKAEADAAREAKEVRHRAVVDRPVSDPSTALVHVDSQRNSGAQGSSLGPPSLNPASQRLRPFGDAQYWGDQPPEGAVMWDEMLMIDLPPLPDLRDPGQVTTRERFRDTLVAKQAERKVEAEEAREMREIAQRSVVNAPVDTSAAPVQVHFRGEGNAYGANRGVAPETVADGRSLKPFGGGASYVPGERRKSGSGGGLLSALTLNPATLTLEPLGDETYWGNQQPPRFVASEEHLIDLPPMPDLRDPGQITMKERFRDTLIAKQAERKAEADAERERLELAQRTMVSSTADPSTAPIQVQPRSGGAYGVGSIAAPEAVRDGRPLTPFDGGSSYVPGEGRKPGSMGGILGAMTINPATQTLQPTGDEPYWGDQKPARLVAPEEQLIDLPPMPDLRDPGQITKKERLRDSLVAKQAARNAEAEAERERRELMQRNVVNRPVPDPSTALVQVQPQSSGAAYAGNRAAPEAVGEGRTLKPFNENSTYTQGNWILFKGPNSNSSSGGGLFRRKTPAP